MRNFYVTYQQKYYNLRNCYSKVEALNYEEARDIVASARGADFAFMYNEDEFAGQAAKYGLTTADLHEEGLE